MKKLIFLPLFLFADEYSFDLGEFEKKPFEYKGYIKLDPKITYNKNSKESSYSSINEIQFEPTYQKDWININANFSLFNMIYSEDENKNNFVINSLYQRFGEDLSFTIGKQSLKWGKGYVYNPIAFLDREKDPLNPESIREGYILAEVKYIQTFSDTALLKNHSFSFVYMPSDENINDEYYEKESSKENFAFKYYMLLADTDIDLIYLNGETSKYGFDISKNLLEELEVHLEYAITEEKDMSYLVGFKYAGNYDITLTTEYYRKNEDKFIYNKLAQKEPFGIIYSNVYVTYQKNLDKNKYQSSFDFSYNFKNGFVVEAMAVDSTDAQSFEIKGSYYF